MQIYIQLLLLTILFLSFTNNTQTLQTMARIFIKLSAKVLE